jgi:hypothetical protein
LEDLPTVLLFVLYGMNNFIGGISAVRNTYGVKFRKIPKNEEFL